MKSGREVPLVSQNLLITSRCCSKNVCTSVPDYVHGVIFQRIVRFQILSRNQILWDTMLRHGSHACLRRLQGGDKCPSNIFST